MEEASYSIISYSGGLLPEEFKNMILSKWMRSLRFGNDYFKLIDSAAYYEIYPELIKRYLSRLTVTIRIAVLTDDQDCALGFSVTEAIAGGRILHYVHVHKDQRKQGIARSLVPPDITFISHLTKTGLSLWSSKLPKAKLNPFL